MAPRLKPLRVHILIRRSREARRLPSRFSGRPEFCDPPPPSVYRHDAAPSSGPRVSQVLELARALSNSSDRPHMFTASIEYAYLAPPLVNDHQIAIPVPGHRHDPVEQERVRSFDDTDAQRRLSGQARVCRVTRRAGDDPHPGRIGDCGILTPHFQRPAQTQNRQRRTNQPNRPHLTDWTPLLWIHSVLSHVDTTSSQHGCSTSGQNASRVHHPPARKGAPGSSIGASGEVE